MRGAFCLLGLLFFGGFPVHGQDKATSATGEALPPGAVERLGSPRFRVTGPVFGARFLDGGKKLLVRVHHQPQSSFDHGKGDFHIFDMNSGLEQSRLPWELNVILGHWGSTGPIRDFIAFPHWCLSPNAALLATVDHWTVRVREVATGKSVLDVRDDDLDFAFVQFTPEGKRVAAIAARRDAPDKTDREPLVVIRMWDLETRKEVHKFTPPPGATETFQAHWFMFSPDSTFLAATGYEDGKAGVVRIWETAGKNASWLLPGQTAKRDQARAIAISHDSKTLAATHEGRIKLWNLSSRKQVKDLADFKGRCATLDFSPDGKTLIAGVGKEAGDRLSLWNLASGEEIVLPLQRSLAYVFSSDGRSLVLADTDNGKLIVCDAATGKVRKSFRARVPQSSREQLEHAFYKARQGMGWPFALTPDGKTLMACDQPGQLRRFDVATGTEIPAPGSPMAPATALAFAPEGRKLLAAGLGKVVLHDLEGKASPLELQLPTKTARNKSKEKSNPEHVAVSSDGKRIAGGWDDGVVCLWDVDTGKLLWQTDGHELCVSSLAFVHGDKELVTTGSYDGAMHWRNVADGKRKNTFAVDANKPLFQRRRLWPARAHWSAFCVDDRRWQEYELATRQVRRELAIDGPMETLSPDGRFFVTAGECWYNLIEQSSGKSERIFAWIDVEHPYYNPGSRVHFSPDSRMIAEVAGKDVVRVWDRDSGTVLASLAGHHGGAVDALAILQSTLESLPKTVKEPARFPLGAYRGLKFGLILHPNYSPEVYLEGQGTRRDTLSRDHHGPRAVLNAAVRLAGSYAGLSDSTRKDLQLSEGQLRDYQARLGKPFPHDQYLTSLTDLRDQLKASLSGTAQVAGAEPAPAAAEIAEQIKALKAASAVEAAPQRAAKPRSSAEEPVTARIRRRHEATHAALPLAAASAENSSLTPKTSTNGLPGSATSPSANPKSRTPMPQNSAKPFQKRMATDAGLGPRL